MVIKIFYFFVSFFTVALVFLSVQTPYANDFVQDDISIANLEIFNATDFELTPSSITSKVMSKKILRYDDKIEFNDIMAVYNDGKDIHYLDSKKAVLKDDIIKFYDDSNYKNSGGMYYFSDEINYDFKNKIVYSDTNFTLLDNSTEIKGESIKYFLKDGKIQAQRINGWHYIN